MDPFTQCLLGAVTVQSVFTGRLGRVCFLLGAVSGELADADVLLGPWTDPALSFELHRHFTHALAFVPVGGLIAAAPFLLFPAMRKKARLVCAATILGYGTHGLLDNCTSYGTHLLWPFIAERTAWDSISIIDPIFTLVLLAGAIAALIRGAARPARIALAIGLLYIAGGFVQHERAADVQRELARQRGHEIESARVMPTLGNLVLWRSVYVADGALHADAIRLVPFEPPRVREGTSRRRFTSGDLPSSRDPERLLHVFERADAFATAMMAERTPGDGRLVGDMRYSLDTAGFVPLWGIAIDPDAAEPARFRGFPIRREGAFDVLRRDIFSPGPTFLPLATSGRTRDR